jgi:uncharacterized protein (DUF2336 family)
MVMAFDTHEAAKEYGRAGFTEAQVEALVNVARRTTTRPDISHLATKSDISALKADISGLKINISELKADIASAKFQATAIILPGMAAIVGVGTVLSHLRR